MSALTIVALCVGCLALFLGLAYREPLPYIAPRACGLRDAFNWPFVSLPDPITVPSCDELAADITDGFVREARYWKRMVDRGDAIRLVLLLAEGAKTPTAGVRCRRYANATALSLNIPVDIRPAVVMVTRSESIQCCDYYRRPAAFYYTYSKCADADTVVDTHLLSLALRVLLPAAPPPSPSSE
jgi:hypothetical protein